MPSIKQFKRCGCAVRQRRAPGHPGTGSLSRLLTIAAVPARLKILFLIRSPHCVCDLVTHTGLSQTLVSHHLADIARAGLAQRKRTGGFTDYRLTAKGRTFVEFLKNVAV